MHTPNLGQGHWGKWSSSLLFGHLCTTPVSDVSNPHQNADPPNTGRKNTALFGSPCEAHCKMAHPWETEKVVVQPSLPRVTMAVRIPPGPAQLYIHFFRGAALCCAGLAPLLQLVIESSNPQQPSELAAFPPTLRTLAKLYRFMLQCSKTTSKHEGNHPSTERRCSHSPVSAYVWYKKCKKQNKQTTTSNFRQQVWCAPRDLPQKATTTCARTMQQAETPSISTTLQGVNLDLHSICACQFQEFAVEEKTKAIRPPAPSLAQALILPLPQVLISVVFG